MFLTVNVNVPPSSVNDESNLTLKYITSPSVLEFRQSSFGWVQTG